MDFERPPTKNEVDDYDLSFTIDTTREGKMIYFFKHVGIVIDKSGKNFKDLPELLFGTFDNEPIGDVMAQPEVVREGVDMSYIAACVAKVAEVSGDRVFWLYPYGGDVPEEKRERRERARARLFSRLGSLEPGPDNYGYILRI